MRTGLLRLAVGLALADSSIVTLALPEILREFDVSVTTVAWVLTSFNLVLALVALPAAYLARRRPQVAFVAGTIVFAAASLLCGIATDFDLLVGARCIQAVGAALVVTAALSLLAETAGSQSRASRLWVTAGVLGAALGPAAGGVLTQALGWQSIFLAQVPLALVTLVAVRGLDPRPSQTQAERPHLRVHAALLLLSGGLVAALFLLVLLLVEGWGMSPAAAGVVVTVLPLAAIAAARLGPRFVADTRIRTICGIVLAAGGLAALALLPRAGWIWTIAPQLLVAAGVGLALVTLTERALVDRPDTAVQGGWTIASRHAGVVLGLLLLAPLLTDALESNRDEAVRAGAAVVLDSSIPALEKLQVAQDVLDEVDEADDRGELPNVSAVFEDRDDDDYRALASALQDQLDRAVTAAFSTPFFLAALLALAALIPVSIGRWEAR